MNEQVHFGPQKPQSLFVTLFDPMAPTLNPNAPANVKDLKDFPSGLPVCQSPIRDQVLDSNALGRMVTIKGNLRRGRGADFEPSRTSSSTLDGPSVPNLRGLALRTGDRDRCAETGVFGFAKGDELFA